MKLKDVLKPLKDFAPESTAEPWDNVGLQVGSQLDEVEKVLLTVDVTESTVDEAVEKGCQLIVSHHPMIFKPLKSLEVAGLVPRTLVKAIKSNIAIYCAHTNLDLAEGGVNHALSDALGLLGGRVKGLVASGYNEFAKVVVYVSEDAVDQVKEALWRGGAGHIGNYDHCLYQIEGTGQFRPLEGTDPYLGTQGEDTQISEIRLETIVSLRDYPSLIEKVKEAHPYEEPVIDVFPLHFPKNTRYMGMICTLDRTVELEELQARWGKKTMFVGEKKPIKKVAVLGGSGGRGVEYAVKGRVDLFVTGELDYHDLIALQAEGVAALLLGHGASEAPVLEALQEILPVDSIISQNPYFETF